MTEIKLEKRYPHSRMEDITDAFMRGYQQGKEDEHRWWSNHCANCKEAEQTEPMVYPQVDGITPSVIGPKTENPCDGCVCDDGKHLIYCMNCKGIAWKTEPPKIEDEPQKWTKENCKGCKYNEYPYDSGTCFVRVCINGNKYEPKE